MIDLLLYHACIFRSLAVETLETPSLYSIHDRAYIPTMGATYGDGPSSNKDDVGNNTFSFFMKKMRFLRGEM